MEIILKDDNAKETYAAKESIVWKLHSKKYVKFILLNYLIGLILLLIGILIFNDYNYKSEYHNYQTSEYHVTYVNYHMHLTILIGIVFVLSASLNLYYHIKGKNDFFRKINESKTKLFKEVIIQISDGGISYKSFLLESEMKWTFFSMYKIYDNFLFLYSNDALMNSICIDKNLMSEEEFSQVMSFIKNRLVKEV